MSARSKTPTASAGDEKRAAAYFDSWDPEAFGEDEWYQREIHGLTSGSVQGATLDLGCGSRVYYDVSGVTRWVGMDVSAPMLGDVRFFRDERPASAQLVRSSCERIPFADASFDTVCAIFLLHHLARRNVAESRARVCGVLGEVRRVLRPGGRVVVAENAARPLQWPYRRLFTPGYAVFRRFTSIELPYFWTRDELLELLDGAGLRGGRVSEIPIREPIRDPMLGFAIPPVIDGMLQRMTLTVASASSR